MEKESWISLNTLIWINRYKIVYRYRKPLQICYNYYVDYFIQTLSFLLNLSLIKFRRGIVARLTPPYIKVNSSSIGSANGDCQSYAAEVNTPKIDVNINN